MPVVIATVILATRGVDRPGSWRGPDDDGTPLATHQVSSLPSVHPWPRDPDGPGAATLGALEKLAHVHPDRGVHMASRWLFTMVRAGPRTTSRASVLPTWAKRTSRGNGRVEVIGDDVKFAHVGKRRDPGRRGSRRYPVDDLEHKLAGAQGGYHEPPPLVRSVGLVGAPSAECHQRI